MKSTALRLSCTVALISALFATQANAASSFQLTIDNSQRSTQASIMVPPTLGSSPALDQKGHFEVPAGTKKTIRVQLNPSAEGSHLYIGTNGGCRDSKATNRYGDFRNLMADKSQYLLIMGSSPQNCHFNAAPSPGPTPGPTPPAGKIAAGNGVIIDDVAQDIHTSGAGFHSTTMDAIKLNYQADGKTIYLMPDFASIIQKPGAAPHWANDSCSTHTQEFTFNYSSLPLIKSTVVNRPEILGTCIPGQEITRLYHQSLPKADIKVLPMFNGSADQLNQWSISTQRQLAEAIATEINSDPYAAGVSFDLEGPGMSDSTIENFIGRISELLQTKGKIVAVFDAKVAALAKVNAKYHNAMALQALYDFGLDPKHPYRALSESQYKMAAANAVKAYLGGYGAKLPVMFVVPGAATTTLYEHLNLFNQEFAKPEFTLPNVRRTPCSDPQLLGDNQSVLQEFLTKPATAQDESALNYFLSNCKRFDNPNQVNMSQYLTDSLGAIEQEQGQLIQGGEIVGALLYNQKPDGFYALTAAKRADSIFYTPSLHKRVLAFYPESISADEWSALSSFKLSSSHKSGA
ncbi:hypothetical protein [Dongshaea marina]|uniref:hypothetical protein n=1 Tax=Dongshaea marina TaxID=2047966 RepID=UPI000D3E0796|nr:hypothetical protein [Dongshaea marina]